MWTEIRKNEKFSFWFIVSDEKNRCASILSIITLDKWWHIFATRIRRSLDGNDAFGSILIYIFIDKSMSQIISIDRSKIKEKKRFMEKKSKKKTNRFISFILTTTSDKSSKISMIIPFVWLFFRQIREKEEGWVNLFQEILTWRKSFAIRLIFLDFAWIHCSDIDGEVSIRMCANLFLFLIFSSSSALIRSNEKLIFLFFSFLVDDNDEKNAPMDISSLCRIEDREWCFIVVNE